MNPFKGPLEKGSMGWKMIQRALNPVQQRETRTRVGGGKGETWLRILIHKRGEKREKDFKGKVRKKGRKLGNLLRGGGGSDLGSSQKDKKFQSIEEIQKEPKGFSTEREKVGFTSTCWRLEGRGENQREKALRNMGIWKKKKRRGGFWQRGQEGRRIKTRQEGGGRILTGY